MWFLTSYFAWGAVRFSPGASGALPEKSIEAHRKVKYILTLPPVCFYFARKK